MSKSERAMLNVSFWGLIFLMSLSEPLIISHLGPIDMFVAIGAGILALGYAFHFLWLTIPQLFRKENHE